MLSDVDIDNLIQPFVDRQEQLSTDIICEICERVKEIGSMSKADVYKLKRLYNASMSASVINKMIADTMQVQEKNVKSMIKQVAIDTYIDAKPFYDYRHKKQIPYSQNKKLQRTVEAISNTTAKTFQNISKSQATGFMISNPKNSNLLKFHTVPQAYQATIDKAIQAVTTGVLDFDTAMRGAIKELNDSGLRRAYWNSGYTRRLDSTVRMNILGGIRSVNQEVQKQIANEINADGIEISAHDFSAPDHEPVQGHIFTIKNFEQLQNEMSFEDVNKNKFSAIRRPIGEWNCKHFTQAVIIDAHKPTWSLKELDELKKRNHKGYKTKNGKHKTMYECSQIQRRYETSIRYAKEGYMSAKSANNQQLIDYYKTRIAELNKQYNQFSKDCGLRKQKNRTSVRGFSY